MPLCKRCLSQHTCDRCARPVEDDGDEGTEWTPADVVFSLALALAVVAVATLAVIIFLS